MIDEQVESKSMEEVAATPLTDSVLERLAARLGGEATARTVFGDPVREDGVTVIPVSRARFGFGMGRKGSEGDEGGGGGAQVSPVGYIEIRNGEVSFRSLRGMIELVPVIVAGGFTAMMVFRALRGLAAARACRD